MKKLSLIAVVLLFTACQQVIYNNIAEKEANEMMVLLLENGINGTRSFDERSATVDISVPSDQMSKAIQILNDHGYPKNKFSTMGDIFSKDSLVSSPTEEHARFTFAISESLSKTLSELDGVIYAKVHLVIPKERQNKKLESKPSAAVFIKHSHNVALEESVPNIKLLVQGSIEGLKYEDVNVALFPTVVSRKVTQDTVSDSAQKWLPWLGLGLFVIGLFAVGGFMASRGPLGLGKTEDQQNNLQ